MSGTRPVSAWGPVRLPNGDVRLRVWADQTPSVALKLEGQLLPMDTSGGGWFEAVIPDLADDAGYLFHLPDGTEIPDPASRGQVGDVHGPSRMVGETYSWKTEWQGRPWEEAVIYELHIGTFTPEGTFRAAIDRLDHLADLGVTAIEIMPVAQFSGQRGWGYDGVLLYAPHNAYGAPDDLRALVDAAHERGLMVLLDVVYNHFGPDGNYLAKLAPGFFDENRHTPWGAGIAYEKRPVRDFFIDNALYWLEAFRLDGLRLDAIDQIVDPSDTHILVEIAERVREAFSDRHIHLTTEDNRNVTHLHERRDGHIAGYSGEWNDDCHNAAHVIATGETEGYYEDFADEPIRQLARSLAEGFAYQGEPSLHAGRQPRGTPSGHLPPTAFINFLQNHDQVGNRALGERLVHIAPPEAMRALTSILLLSPAIPLLWMGEEFAAQTPFLFFTDFHGELGKAVREGRRREFASFTGFATDPEAVPDPNALETFLQSKLDWQALDRPDAAEMLDFYRDLLAIRQREIVPLLGHATQGGRVLESETSIVAVDWVLGDRVLHLRANLGSHPGSAPFAGGRVIHRQPEDDEDSQGDLPPWRVVWSISHPHQGT